MELTTPTSTTPSMSIGGLLRQAREEKNIPLKMIAQKTKISLSLLEHLEADDLRQLPNKAYVIGFIKSYAKALSIDEKKCLDYFHHTYNRVFPESLPSPKPTKSKVSKKFIVDPKKIPVSFSKINPRHIGGTLGGLLLFLFLAVMLTKTDKSKVQTTEQVEVVELLPEESSPEELASEIQQKPEVKEEIKPQTLSASTPLETAKDSPIKNPLAIQEKPAETTEPTSANKDDLDFVEKLKSITFRKLSAGPLYKILHDDPNGDISEYLPDSVQNAFISGQQNLYITAIDGDTWLTYRKNKGKTFQRHLKAGDSLYLQGKEIQLFMGNVNATKIFLNNIPLLIRSRTGVKSLIFPQDQKDKYHIPLFLFKKDGTVIPSDIAIEQLKTLKNTESTESAKPI